MIECLSCNPEILSLYSLLLNTCLDCLSHNDLVAVVSRTVDVTITILKCFAEFVCHLLFREFFFGREGKKREGLVVGEFDRWNRTLSFLFLLGHLIINY